MRQHTRLHVDAYSAGAVERPPGRLGSRGRLIDRIERTVYCAGSVNENRTRSKINESSFVRRRGHSVGLRAPLALARDIDLLGLAELPAIVGLNAPRPTSPQPDSECPGNRDQQPSTPTPPARPTRRYGVSSATSLPGPATMHPWYSPVSLGSFASDVAEDRWPAHGDGSRVVPQGAQRRRLLPGRQVGRE